MRKMKSRVFALTGLFATLSLQSIVRAELVTGQGMKLSTSIETGGLAIANANTGLAASLQQYLNQGPFLRIGNQLIELTDIREFYKKRGFTPIWILDGRPNAMAIALRDYSVGLEKHGLRTQEYWTPMVEAAYQNSNSQPSDQASVTSEILLTEAYLRTAQHLANGRFDPDQIDNDIKFKRKFFSVSDMNLLSLAVSGDPAQLAPAIDSLTPQIPTYKDLMAALQELKDRKTQNLSYTRLSFPGVSLKPGATSPMVGKLRQALKDRGYATTTEGDVYDSELEAAVVDFQLENGMEAGSTLGARSDVWRNLGYSLDQRTKQIEVSLEKLRWLPRTLEAKYIFVNSAFSEFRAIENNVPVLEMRTVNGRPTWRTPSMRDVLVAAILNPTWTATDSIVTQIKLPELKRDPGYLDRIKMHLKDRVTGEIIPTDGVNWATDGMDLVKRAIFVQDPGRNNALGVVKFPLAVNRDDIYMHDTNERELFVHGMRQRSSGCIRLEKPLDLAYYVLQGTEYTPDKINELVVKDLPDEVYETNLRINLPKEKWIPVYILYLTVEKTKTGRIRFATDYYGQDTRVATAVNQSTLKREGN
jgi:murein L,D-transpeptidase YcbB/YkuD